MTLSCGQVAELHVAEQLVDADRLVAQDLLRHSSGVPMMIMSSLLVVLDRHLPSITGCSSGNTFSCSSSG